MLRVTITENSSGQTFLLEGELAGPSVSELENAWRSRSGTLRKVVVDLSEVTFIDEIGERLLARMSEGRTEFLGGGVSIREQLGRLGIIVSRQSDVRGKQSNTAPFALLTSSLDEATEGLRHMDGAAPACILTTPAARD